MDERLSGNIDWPGRIERIRRLGVGGLDNGLTVDENERLFETRNLTEMIALVLKGLRTRFEPAPPKRKTSKPGRKAAQPRKTAAAKKKRPGRRKS